ncbi:MAG: sporulation membrane protein YtaF [Bacillaceae bacterium]|nr:sporulation membrane protein YtaF [Bacillaceae bacterium]
MFEYLSLLALAAVVSLDGFGVGVSYGLRKIKIPVFSILIIAGMTAAAIYISMQLGQWISFFMDQNTARHFGAWTLIILGIWAIINFYRNRETSHSSVQMTKGEINKPKSVLNIEIKTLGLVIHILKKPTMADMDCSGSITGMEAALLGAALSLDAFGAGIGAALIGYHPLLTASVVSTVCIVFIGFGMKVGFLYANTSWVKKLSFLPGVILILLGISKIWV